MDIEMDSESLIRILRGYDASFDTASVKAAFDDNQAKPNALVDWVALHLAPDTLLSASELSQFNALEKSGSAAKLASSPDVAAVQSFGDQEIKAAIEELDRSTDAITKQTEALRQQQDALDRLVNGARRDAEARVYLESRQAQKWDARRRSVTLAVDELSHAVDARIVELEQQGKGDGANIQKTVDALFHADDKLLSSLQKLGWELETEDPEQQDNVVMLRETCARLIKFTVEGLRTKLDRIYLEALEASMRSGTTNRVSVDEVSALQDEVESLYAEILPVAQMSAKQQFLSPALSKLATENGQSFARSEQAVRYIHECLDYLLDHAQDLTTRIEAFQAYQSASNALVDVARSELATDVLLPAKKERRPTVGASPTRQGGNLISPVRPAAKSRPRRSSGIGGGVSDDAALDELLRSLAISLPQDDSAQAQVGALAFTLADRRVKARNVAQNVQESFEGAATKQIADAKLAIQTVRDSVLAESPFNQVRLVDPEIEGSIAVLSQEIDNVKVKLDVIDTGLVKTRGKSTKKEELITRWG